MYKFRHSQSHYCGKKQHNTIDVYVNLVFDFELAFSILVSNLRHRGLAKNIYMCYKNLDMRGFKSVIFYLGK
jgi:hypothetical protein